MKMRTKSKTTLYHVFHYLLQAISYKGLYDALIVLVIQALKFQGSLPGKGVKCYHHDTQIEHKDRYALCPTPTLYGMIMKVPSNLGMKVRIHVRTPRPHTLSWRCTH